MHLVALFGPCLDRLEGLRDEHAQAAGRVADQVVDRAGGDRGLDAADLARPHIVAAAQLIEHLGQLVAGGADLAGVHALAVGCRVARHFARSHRGAEGVALGGDLDRQVDQRGCHGQAQLHGVRHVHCSAERVDRSEEGGHHVHGGLAHGLALTRVLLVAVGRVHHVAQVREEVQAVLQRDLHVPAALAHPGDASAQGLARLEHDDQVALLLVVGHLVPVQLAVVVLAAGRCVVGSQRHGGSSQAEHGAGHLRVLQRLEELRVALHGRVEEQVPGVQRAADLAPTVEVGCAVLGQAGGLGRRLVGVACGHVHGEAGGVLRHGAGQLQQAGCAQRGPVDVPHAGQRQSLGGRAPRPGAGGSGQQQVVLDLLRNVLDVAHVEAARDAAVRLELVEQAVHLGLVLVEAQLLLDGRGRGRAVVQHEAHHAVPADVVQRGHHPRLHVTRNVHGREDRVVTGQHVAHPGGVPAGHHDAGPLEVADLFLPDLAQRTQRGLVVDLDEHRRAADLDADRVVALVDRPGQLHHASSLVERLAGLVHIHAPQVGVGVRQHEVQQHLADVVSLRTNDGALVVADHVLDQVARTRAAAQCLDRLVATHVDPTAHARAHRAGVLVHVLEATQRHVVLVLRLHGIVVVLGDQAFLEQDATGRGRDGHQVGVQVLHGLRLRASLHLLDQGLGVGRLHAGAAVRESVVDPGDRVVALLGMLGVGVQRQLVHRDVGLRGLLDHRLDGLVAELVHHRLHAAGHQRVGQVHVLRFADCAALFGDHLLYALQPQRLVLDLDPAGVDLAGGVEGEALADGGAVALHTEHRQPLVHLLADGVAEGEAGLLQRIHLRSQCSLGLGLGVERLAARVVVAALEHPLAVDVLVRGCDLPAVFVGGDVDRGHLPTTHLRQQFLQGCRDDGVVEHFHSGAAHLEVKAGELALAASDVFPFAVYDLLGHLLADQIFKLAGRHVVLLDQFAPISGCDQRVGSIVFFPDDHRIYALAQVIPIRRLLPIDKSNFFIPTLCGHGDDALEGEVEPAFGLGDEGGGGHTLPTLLPVRPSLSAFLGTESVLDVSVLVHHLPATRHRFGSRFGTHSKDLRPPEPLLLPLLPPVRLNLLNEQHAVAVRIGAVVDADVGEDVGLVPVGGFVERPAFRCIAKRFPHGGQTPLRSFLIGFAFVFLDNECLAAKLEAHKVFAAGCVLACCDNLYLLH